MDFIKMVVIIAAVTSWTCLSQTDTRLSDQIDDIYYSNEIQCTKDHTCPTWFFCNSYNICQCENDHDGIIACDDKKLTSEVLDCHCVTYDEDTRSTFAGSCFYNCENHHSKTKNDLVYYTLPRKPEMLVNKSICSYFNRKGLLCGDCEDGHSPLVLSYNLSCVKCPDGHKNWWKFILIAFVPLTFFYFFIVLFNINVTTSRLHGVVWFSQAASNPTMVRLIMSALAQGNPKLLKSANIIMIFYSFWNLELFRSIMPDICLDVSTLQALTLEYVVALYPFLLILISYYFIELYDRKVACIVTIWTPIDKLLKCFRKSWNVRTSVIDSFATFFLLSYIKILSVSTDLLVPTQIYQLGSNKTSFGLYYSPSVVYFGKEHLPYAILAIIIFIAFVVIPTTIFFLYPFQCFHKVLSVFPFNWHFLHAFVDSFQGCYKDGTEPGTFDCRWFSVIILLTRTIVFIVYGLTLSMMYLIYGTIIITVLLIAIINVQPFKKVVVRYPSTDAIFIIIFNIFYICCLGRSVASMHNDIYNYILEPLLLATGFSSLVYIGVLITSWLLSRRVLITRYLQSTNNFFS